MKVRQTMNSILPTCLVGSYPQPDWLLDRTTLSKQTPPRTKIDQLWRVQEPWLKQAKDDAALLAIREQEAAGLDIITDGEIRRTSYSNEFANALDGIDHDNPGQILSRGGVAIAAPRVVGKIKRRHAVQAEDVRFLKRNTDRAVKITVPGPFTMSQQAQNDFYSDDEDMALDYAAAVNAEIKDLFAAGADVVQIDEPYMQASPEKARKFGVRALNAALDGVTGTTATHLCFGYALNFKNKAPAYDFLTELEQSNIDQISIETAQCKLDCSALSKLSKTIILGVIDLADTTIETPEIVAERIRRALPYVPAERLIIAPDCGMKYLSREAAFGKLRAMVEGAKIVRAELGH